MGRGTQIPERGRHHAESRREARDPVPGGDQPLGEGEDVGLRPRWPIQSVIGNQDVHKTSG